MNVRELIEHLKTMDQDLEVWYLSGGEYGYQATTEEAREYELEDPETGKDFRVCIIGEIP
jgi:hypothetical protein